MPRINKEKGKQHHMKNGGNAKSIRASAAERRGAQKGGGSQLVRRGGDWAGKCRGGGDGTRENMDRGN